MKDQVEMLMARKDAYKDRAADLEVRVRNNHELLIDLRESEYKLEMERRLMHERHRQLKGELEALRSRPEQSHISRLEKELAEERQRADLLATQLEAAQLRTPVPDTVADLTRTIDDLKRRLKEKDEQIYELQHVNKALHLDLEELDTQQAKLAAEHDEALTQESRKRRTVKERAKQTELENIELREIVEAQGQDLVSVQEEYERLRKLLHAEMRNQAKESICRNLIPGTPSSTDGYLELVAVEARRRVQALIAREDGGSSNQPVANPYERIEQLEREVQHHVNELIRCKRDNRSYKKDIKRANTKIDRMRSSMYGGDNASPQPLHRKPSLQNSITSIDSPVKQKPNTAGLGISTLLPSPATSAPSSQPTSAVTGNISDSSFPANRPKTPVRSNTNKKLPPYPSLPEQVASQLSNLPPPSDAPSQPPPKDPPSRPKTPRTPKTPTYKLTPTITRVPSLNSIRPTPPSPATKTRPAPHRFNTATCFGSDTNPSSPAPGPPVTMAPSPQRNVTQRSLSESIISSYANNTPPTTNNINGSALSGVDDSSNDNRPKTPAKDANITSAPDHRESSAERRAIFAQAVKGPAEVVDHTAGLTALPQRPVSGWKAERREQEEKLWLIRKRSDDRGFVSAGVRRKESQDSFLKRVGSVGRRSLAVEGVISRFNSRGRGASESAVGGGLGGVVVPVMLEGADERGR
ncbi:hypothetical protein MPH_10673 [Macrophomina phaseolina MS6]|uniref:Uncharacterized protein n=1 Tax=Macrophomina phaseolina (strain MS6) TaxID=1126212 RepID=K2S650_MACPH|nr:hypothetical protein MPH_10673 [Macrophomina phaseolina MS6]